MGLRLETVLILVTIVIIMVTTMVKLTNTVDNNQTTSKELEFSNTTFIEVDREKMQAHAYSTYGVRDAGVLRLEGLRYQTNNIHLLLADVGIYKQDTLYLDGNVSLQEKEGFLYTTEHAKYNQKSEVLEVTSSFTATMNKNSIKGETLRYTARQTEVNATNIHAIIYTTEK